MLPTYQHIITFISLHSNIYLYRNTSISKHARVQTFIICRNTVRAQAQKIYKILLPPPLCRRHAGALSLTSVHRRYQPSTLAAKSYNSVVNRTVINTNTVDNKLLLSKMTFRRYAFLALLSMTTIASTWQFEFKHHDNTELPLVLNDVHQRCPHVTRVYTLSEKSVRGIPLYAIEFGMQPGRHQPCK